jgi:hypothetical protein
MKWEIIPGNRYFRLEEESYYFNRNMPLGAEEREGRLHREIVPSGERRVTENEGLTRPTCLDMK